jgi:general secretion pathway protein G
VALVCGHGLWTLRPHGWYVQVGLSILGLLGFPLGTIINILILYYMFKPGVRVLFSGKPVERLGPVERAQLLSLSTGNTAAIVVAIIVAIPMGIAVMGIMAAIAVPNFLTAVDRGKQKRTMADLRAIGTALEAYAVDHNMYPTATTAAALKDAIEPRYIKAMPTIDGWGHAIEASSSDAAYKLYSRGKDGVGSDCEASATVKFDDEICFADGKFVRYPEALNR